MKRLNNQGFLLFEALIATIFIASTLIYVFVQFKLVSNNYDKAFTYDNVNNIYALGNVDRYLKDQEIIYSLVENTKTGNYYAKYECPVANTYCSKLFESLGLLKTENKFEVVIINGNKIQYQPKITDNSYRNYIKQLANSDVDYYIIGKFSNNDIASIPLKLGG